MTSSILQGNRILIVEDIEATRRLIVRLLEGMGCTQVLEADSVEAAWRHLDGQMIDLMLLDYELEDGNGSELIRDLRAQPDRANHAVPTIMLTGHSAASVVEETIRAGADAFLVKPVMPNKLGRRILEVLAGRKAARAGRSKPLARSEVQWI